MEDNSKEIEEIQNLLKFYEKLGESNKFIVAYISELNKRGRRCVLEREIDSVFERADKSCSWVEIVF